MCYLRRQDIPKKNIDRLRTKQNRYHAIQNAQYNWYELNASTIIPTTFYHQIPRFLFLNQNKPVLFADGLLCVVQVPCSVIWLQNTTYWSQSKRKTWHPNRKKNFFSLFNFFFVQTKQNFFVLFCHPILDHRIQHVDTGKRVKALGIIRECVFHQIPRRKLNI